ncbi:TIGR02450 family Trp-rich protein [Neosynechococcus sphagnicola]|uniref:TIGR02450 family Trp-rich protein n=1 Tax=Neosynechococcus sphagnicola TaxID=1501145 RepID=UPI0009DECED5
MSRTLKFPYLVGSKWTAHRKVDGWRHFRVVNRKNLENWVFAEIVAACDPKVRFWLNAQLLKEPTLWQTGWRSLQEAAATEIPVPEAAPIISPQPQLADSWSVPSCQGR